MNKGDTLNLSLKSALRVLDDETILILNNEMISDKITVNNSVICGLRLSGFAHYYTEGKYFNILNKYFNNETHSQQRSNY